MFERLNRVKPVEINKSPENKNELLTIVSGFRSQKANYRKANETSQDALVVDNLRRFYGVYDGAGGAGGNPAAAAQVAARSMHKSLGEFQPRSTSEFVAQLRNANDQARYNVAKYGENGVTVATSVKIIDFDGKTYAGVAHAGDTRLFLFSKNVNNYVSLTDDQSKGNIVYNSFPTKSSVSDQFRVLQLFPGDRLMICSDGITGDWENQFLSRDEFLYAFKQKTPDECAECFLRLSKKNDDKSIIVADAVSLNGKGRNTNKSEKQLR